MARCDQIQAALIEGGVVQDDDNLLSTIVDEVEYAVYPPKHEQKIPTYGSIIVAKHLLQGTDFLDVRKLSVETVRQLADGVSTFAIVRRNKHERILFRTASCNEELELIALHKQTKGMLIHRNHHSVVRVFRNEAIFTHESGTWFKRPYSRSVMGDVEKAVPQADLGILDHILQFAFHALSPSNVGATLVWWINDRKKVPKGGRDLSASGMGAANSAHFNALRSLLRQHDGALFIAPNGQVQSIGQHLKYTKNAEKFIKQVGGTRHTSAKRYSFDQPNAVVFVISEDGPVSVFSDGVKVTELAQETAVETAKYLRNLVPSKAEDVHCYSRLAKCPNCGKKITVDVIVIYGLRDRENGNCPICGTEVHNEMCWQINTRVVKVLPHETELDHIIRSMQ